MTNIIVDKDIQNDRLSDKPYLRANLTSSLELSTSWQRLDFSGTSALNANNFPDSETVPGTKLVDWDATNDRFNFNRDTTGIYLVELGFEFSGGLRPAEVQMRFVIDTDPVIAFPFPDTNGYIVIADLQSLSMQNVEYNRPIRSTGVIQTGGLAVELRLGSNLLTKPSLTHAIVEIYPV